MNKTKTFTKILSLLMAILMLSSVVIIPASAATAPKAPTSISVARTTTSIKLSWPKVKGANGYRIYYKLPGDISWRTAVKSTTATNHTFNNLSWGKSYKFAVRSYTKSGSNTVWGGYKEVATATKTPAPKKLTATQTTNAIKLTWSKVESAKGYRIYYKTTSAGSWKVAVNSTDKTSHTFKNLSSGKKYFFAVKTYTKSTFGTFFGDYKSIGTASKPATPTLKASATSSSISLSWSKVNGADGYRVYYKTGSSGWKTAVSSTTATSGTFKNLPANKTYTFAVKAYVKTESGTIWSGYKQVSATTKSGSGIKDTNPPKLVSFEFLENGKSFNVGETAHIRIKVTDDSAIDFDRTYPVIYNGDHYIWFDLSYNSKTGYIEGSYTFTKSDFIGTYELGYIPCYDIYGNYHHGNPDGEHYIVFGSGGNSDTNPPELISFEFLENGKSFNIGETAYIRMKVTDDSAIDFDRTYPVIYNGDHYIWFDLSYNSKTGYIEGSYTFTESDFIGTYELGYIPCYDIYGNYHHGNPDGEHYITLSAGNSDTNSPKLISFEFLENGKSFNIGETAYIRMKVTDDSAIDFDRTYPVIYNGDHYIWFDLSYNSKTGYIEGSYTFTESDFIGTYELGYIPCYDIYGNYHHGNPDGEHYIIFG